MLQLRSSCETCDKGLDAGSKDARTRSFEFTFRRDCAQMRLNHKHPDCGGELLPGPTCNEILFGRLSSFARSDPDDAYNYPTFNIISVQIVSVAPFKEPESSPAS